GYAIALTLRGMGVEVVPVKDQQFGKDLSGKVMEFLTFAFAGAQVRDAIEQANSTRRTITDAGQLICCGKPAYGYGYDKKKRQRIINPEEEKVVLRIYQAIADGISVYSLCDQLWADQVPTPRGKISRWSEKTIIRMIENPSYRGDKMQGYKYQRQD